MSETTPSYDFLGVGYANVRQPDPRLEAVNHQAIGPGRVLNVGAGSGSYEPRDSEVVALEPSTVMIRQRPESLGPVVKGRAESLPFGSGTFEAVLAVFTLHHWDDQVAGLKELTRVAPRRVIVTFDPVVHKSLWLMDYFPQINELSVHQPLSPAQVADNIEGSAVVILPVPWDCTDGFTTSYWRRPDAYLDPQVHAGSSFLRQIDEEGLHQGLARLENDLRSGRLERRYGHLRELDELDCGVRIVIGQAAK